MRKLMLVLAVTALAAFSISCNQLKARDQLNKGVQAFTAAQYPEAVEHFKSFTVLEYVALGRVRHYSQSV